MADLIVNKNGSITTNKKKKKQIDLFVSSNGTIYVDKNEQKKYISNGNGNGGSFSPIKSPTTKKSKEDKSFLDNLGYIGKNLGAGVVGGLTGLVKSGTTEVKNNLKKSEKEGFFKNALDLFDASQNILNPTKGFAELTKNNIKNIYENVTDKKKTKTQKVTDIALSGLTEAANTFVPGKKLADEAVQLYGNAIGSEKAEKAVDKFDKFASKPYEDLSENIRKESDQYGGKTQLAGTVANVVGNMGPSIAATMLTKNPNIGLGVMGVSAKGSATQEALNRGADLEQAIKIGNAKGMIEVGTEMLTGGVNIFGKGALDNIAERGVDKAVKNKVLNYLGKKGVGIGGEVLEETISDVLGTVIDRGTVDPKASYSIDDWEDTALTTVLSTLVLNALTGGYGKRSYMENSAQLEQQSNEKKVVDSLVNEKASEISKQRATENAINEAISTKETEQGGTLSTKEKAAIKQQIEAKIESGEIELSSSKLSKKEISTIKSEVEEQMNKGLLDTNKINSILGKNKVSKNSILAKSYEETAKKSQKFIQGATKITNENEKAVYDSASKYLNNTTRSHEFVENVAKLSKEKGVNYGFINNEELKSLGHDLEGKQVNGLVRTSQDGTSKVLINIDSPKALNTIVGHETTHLLEGTKEYQELQEAIFNYAKEKGDFDSRQKSLNELYDGIENVNIDSEITADLVGDYLFTDENFVKSLSNQKPTVFQKIKNLIDDLVVKFKGTKEEKQLREVQKKFREAYRNTTTQQNETNLITEANSNTTSDVKYSIIGIKNIDKALNNKNVDENTKNSLNNVKNNYIKALSKEGKESNESIRRETGWFKDRNGDWKFEITDKYSKLKLIPSPNKTYKLGDILDHKLLYDVNPEIKNLKVKFKDLEGKRGQYLNLPVIGSIRINNSLLKKGENEIRSTLLHEIQHYNQHFNKFEKGMSSGETLEDMIKYVNGLGEIEAKNVQERMDLSKAELKSIAPTSSKENPIHPQAEQLIEKRKRQIVNKSKKSYNGFRGMFNEEDIEETNGQNRGLSIQTLGNGLEELDNSSFSFGKNDNNTKNPNLTYGEDVKYQEAISPIQEEISKVTNEVQQMREQINKLVENPYEPSKVGTTEEQTDLYNQNNFDNLENQGIAPIENTTPEQKYENSNEPSMTDTKSLFETRDYAEVGNRKVNAYQYDHPEVKPYFQEAAVGMLSDLDMSTKGERFITGDISQLGNGEYQYTGSTRNTVSDIDELLDGVDGKYKLSYEDIKNGLNAIIEDHGAENTAAAKRLEFYLDKRLRDGYTTIDGTEIEPNQTYIEEMRAKGFDDFYKSIPIDESLAPIENTSNTNKTTNIAPTKQQINEQMIRGKELKAVEEKPTRNINIQQELPLIESQEAQDKKTARILDEKPVREKEQRLKQIATINLVDKGYYISKLARKTNNRQLDALWDNTLLSQAQAQETIGEGRYKFNAATKSYDKVGESVYEIFEGLENANKVKDFNEYMYHKLNIERMSLEQKGETNKPVFGEDVNAFKSQMIVNELEQNNPEFSDYAKRVYEYESGENSDLSALVDAGVLSQEQADYYREKYNNYVPIIRDIDTGFLEGQIFGKRTSVKNPIKNAVGGDQNLLPLKDAMAIKTMLVQKSVNMNKLGLELMYTLNPEVTTETVTADQVIDAMASGKDLIKAGADGKAPTMTVYENGVKTTFEIPIDIYEALKVNNDSFTKLTFKPFNSFSNFKRNVLTQYNPFFMVTNAIKDAQDVLINSQHPFKTYKAIPEAIAQLTSKGYWYREMQSQGLFQDTYYDNIKGFDTKPKGLEKIQEFYPLRKISEINDFIERVPRMAEYIASRKEGRSIEVASLDSQRVTTNFKAGGDFTKFLNRNGATFLNASVQGAVQQVRNVQEAHMQGLKGYMKLATKFTVAALPAVILNSLLWGDDDDYEQLNDYIKDNYYVIGKYGDGQFIRIPKGRMTAVIQKGLENMQDLITGDDEVDLGSYLEMVVNNLAPNNPVENNVLSPFLNTKLFNNDDPGKTWYGSDLVPSRLQDKPAAEQYDETTDEFSKWLGGKLNLSPIKINNLIDQNSGVIGDLILPMMTAEAKTKNTNPVMAGIEDKFTADVVFDNKYSSDFYSEKEKLAKKSNSDKATDEDELKTKFLNSIQSNMNDLHKEIREIQNSDLDKETKYAKVRELNKQINEMARVGLNSYEDMTVNDNYASVSNTEYYKHLDSEGKETWSKINDKEKAALESMNMSDSDKNNYFNAKNTISSIVKDYKNDKSTLSDDDEDSYKEAVASLSSEKKASIINTIKNSGLDDKAKAYLYDKYYGREDKLNVVVSTGIGMDNYLDLEAQNFQSDKDSQGKTISGSKKKKVFEYINSTDLDFEKKIILAKMYYSSYNEYNYDIIEYLNNDNSISYEEEEEILKTLGFKVDSNGNVRW